MQLSTHDTAVTPFIARLATWKLWAVSAALLVPVAWMFFASSAPFAIPEVQAACGQAPPDMRFFTSADGVTQFLDDCGPNGRNTYRNMQLADIVYPAIVGVFMASSLSLALGRLSPRSDRALWLIALPLAGSAFDYLENTLAWLALASYPDPIATSHFLGVASAAKTTASWAAGLVLLAALAAIVARASRERLSATRTDTPVASDRADEREVIGSAP
jgi:hypothetical protein